MFHLSFCSEARNTSKRSFSGFPASAFKIFPVIFERFKMLILVNPKRVFYVIDFWWSSYYISLVYDTWTIIRLHITFFLSILTHRQRWQFNRFAFFEPSYPFSRPFLKRLSVLLVRLPTPAFCSRISSFRLTFVDLHSSLLEKTKWREGPRFDPFTNYLLFET